MTAPAELTDTTGRFEIYRVFTDAEGLLEAIRDRVDELEFSRMQVDAAGGLTSGHASKLLCEPPIKHLGDTSVRKLLVGTGLAVALVVDDARFSEVRLEMGKRRRPPMGKFARMRANAGMVDPVWQFNCNNAREMGLKRMAGVSPVKRKKLAKRAAKARWKKRARQRVATHKARKSGA